MVTASDVFKGMFIIILGILGIFERNVYKGTVITYAQSYTFTAVIGGEVFFDKIEFA